MRLSSCPSCQGFVPEMSTRCPVCDRPRALLSRRGRQVAAAALGLLGGSTLAVTLAACYGAPCAGGGSTCYGPDPGHCDDPSADLDQDGYCGSYDCDEANAEVHLGAFDPEADGVDQDCDGADGVADTAGN